MEEKPLKEAEEYIRIAEESIKNSQVYSPAITNCIMAMIRTTDSLHLEKENRTIRDHSKTAKRFQELYHRGKLPAEFKANLNSIQKWVVEEKSKVQYKDKQYSKKEAEKALKASKRLYRKTREHME